MSHEPIDLLSADKKKVAEENHLLLAINVFSVTNILSIFGGSNKHFPCNCNWGFDCESGLTEEYLQGLWFWEIMAIDPFGISSEDQ